MGVLINKLVSTDNRAVHSKAVSNKSVTDRSKLYKPLNELEWRDITKKERKENSLQAYSKFAF